MSRRLFALVPLVAVSLLAIPTIAQSPPAESLAEHGHWKRLKALIEPQAAANPNDAQAQWLLSRVRMAYKDVDGALALAEKAAALDPKSADYRWQVGQVIGAQAASASMFSALELVNRFKREAEAALALNPKHIAAMTGLMEFYNRAPSIAGGDQKKASELADQILAISTVDGYIAKARLLGQQTPQPLDQIEQVWVQAVTADPSRFEPHLNLANIYAGGKTPRLDLAEKEATSARKIDPDRVTAYSTLAAVYARQERWANLDAVLAEAERKIPDNLSPYLRAATTLQDTGTDLARAERYARKYLSQEPEPTASSHAVAHWRLALVLEKEGKKADAVTELETATKLDPKYEPAQKDLKRLKG